MAASMENVFSNCFQSFLEGDDVLELRELVSVVETNKLLCAEKQSNVQEALGYVHNCLSSSKKRAEGLHLLSTFVKQSSTAVFQQNALTWINLLSTILQGHSSTQITTASAKVLCQIVSCAKNFADISREITNTVIPQLLPLLLSFPTEVVEVALACINTCITHFPGPVGPFKGKIEKFVIEALQQDTCSKELYRCYALLAQCGSGGAQGVKHSEAWTLQCGRALGSASQVLTALYDGLETGDATTIAASDDCLPLSVVTRDQSDRVASLCACWKTLSGCLQALLREKLSATVKVPADAIIRLVARCLAVNANMLLSRPTTERMLIAAFMQDVHLAALNVLESLITGCRTALIPYAAIVVDLLVQELFWTLSSDHGGHSPYSLLRSRVYEVLTTWMKISGGLSCVGREQKSLVKHLIHDCTPALDTLQMTNSTGVSRPDGEPANKKKKRKGYQEITQGISTQRKTDPLANSALVQSALEGLYWMITTTGSEINQKVLQDIQRFVITTLLSLQQVVDLPAPYCQPQCRRGLYRLLQGVTLSHMAGAPSPLHCATRILGTGILDPDIQVSAFCTESLQICESLIHPRVPCLNGPIICENLVVIGKQKPSSNLYKSDATSLDYTKDKLNEERRNVTSNLIVKKRAFQYEDAESDEVIATKVARVNESESSTKDFLENDVSVNGKERNGLEGVHQEKRSSLGVEPVKYGLMPGSSSTSGLVNADDACSSSGEDSEEEADDEEAEDRGAATMGSEDATGLGQVDHKTVVIIDGGKRVGATDGSASGNESAEEDEEVAEDKMEELCPVIASTENKDDQVADVEVGAMLAAFVDASPDSD